MKELLLASSNRGKLAEMRNLLVDLPIKFCTLDRFPQILAVDETGQTYEENAVLKAQGYARQTGLWSLAEDSGLEVDALGNRPGVFSARYAGAGASDGERVSFLLKQLLCAPGADRSARFICAVAIADSESALVNIEFGICEGRIAAAPRGTNGFGYDPVFVPEGYENTFAEVSAETKNAVSHRAKALKATRLFLMNLTSDLTPGVLNS